MPRTSTSGDCRSSSVDSMSVPAGAAPSWSMNTFIFGLPAAWPAGSAETVATPISAGRDQADDTEQR